jgi:DNA-binding response OmpR family regulator
MRHHPSPQQSLKRKILVAEDDPMLLDLLASLLEENGFETLRAQDGEESVELFRQHHAEIALVLTDMGLPKLGGWEAFQEMKKIDPDVQTIMASGFVHQKLRDDMMHAGAVDFVQKPYLMEDVMRKIKQFIGGASGA